MSEIFPRSLLAEAFPNSPRIRAAFEQLGEAVNAFEAKVTELEARAAAVESSIDFQPRSDILDALSNLAADPGTIEQVAAGQFTVRPIDNPGDPGSLITQTYADGRYTLAP